MKFIYLVSNKNYMDDLFLIVIIVLVLVIVVVLLIMRNQKDKKEFESQLKSDYHKPGVHDTDIGENERL